MAKVFNIVKNDKLYDQEQTRLDSANRSRVSDCVTKKFWVDLVKFSSPLVSANFVTISHAVCANVGDHKHLGDFGVYIPQFREFLTP